jgi:hypothetical protein
MENMFHKVGGMENKTPRKMDFNIFSFFNPILLRLCFLHFKMIKMGPTAIRTTGINKTNLKIALDGIPLNVRSCLTQSV